MRNKFLLSGCSFTDPTWQTEVPWSVHFSKYYESYIVAKAGMGIKGICTESLYYLKELENISTLIIIIPDLWRIDIEVDEETYLCNSMVDLLKAEFGDYNIISKATRKWLISGGLSYQKNAEYSKIFDFLYRHQGFLVLMKEHLRSLKTLQDFCKKKNITYYVSAIKDPLDQIDGLNYIKNDIIELLNDVDYNEWFTFDGKFIDKFLQHDKHPSTNEHKLLCDYIINKTLKQNEVNNAETI